jgi:hypothetical protein
VGSSGRPLGDAGRTLAVICKANDEAGLTPRFVILQMEFIASIGRQIAMLAIQIFLFQGNSESGGHYPFLG